MNSFTVTGIYSSGAMGFNTAPSPGDALNGGGGGGNGNSGGRRGGGEINGVGGKENALHSYNGGGNQRGGDHGVGRGAGGGGVGGALNGESHYSNQNQVGF